ncbi:hypothetical protein QQS21_008047 [Conoideocrella luteorostrata]|uniref:Rhodanese domain-containing protein n=1 Tax=Conoideocrella luteorostrata TaxID=1105319 RepID=A0AAJ0FWW0_9HYPO|nr:hypothetical protein QQS21_008047 [Conoideocrella luteorostrata]
MSTSAQTTDTSQWAAAFPEPKAPVHALDPSDVAQLLESHSQTNSNSNKSFLLVDVRRTDWEGGTIATSINLPAHTLYQTRPAIYQLCKQADVKTIIFYCGSSNGRGPRCAGWMQDYLNEVGEASMSSAILKGGIKGWQKKYNGKLMDWYDDKLWAQQNA